MVSRLVQRIQFCLVLCFALDIDRLYQAVFEVSTSINHKNHIKEEKN